MRAFPYFSPMAYFPRRSCLGFDARFRLDKVWMLFFPGWAMGRGSRVASGLNDLDSRLNWLWCFAALLTYMDSAVAAAGLMELLFGNRTFLVLGFLARFGVCVGFLLLLGF